MVLVKSAASIEPEQNLARVGLHYYSCVLRAEGATCGYKTPNWTYSSMQSTSLRLTFPAGQ